jgi:cytochrome c oxidase assembly protein subunit 15
MMVRSYKALPIFVRRRLAVWIFMACGLVFLMVVIGGLTRLTGSGLSMVTWDPVIGAIPPVSDADWQRLFEAYRQTPEGRIVNTDLNVHGFKNIYWLEYIHRLLGRLIGVVFLVPLVVFLYRRWMARDVLVKLLWMFILGGLQGALGWYMVKSGLVDEPHVSPYRLTAHLMLALAIHIYMIRVGLDLWSDRRDTVSIPLRRWVRLALVMVVGTIVSGGFVAGTKAGRVYPTFPLMGDRLVPREYGFLEPAWRNLFENMPAVQFNHRLLATATLVVCGVFFWIGWRRMSAARKTLAMIAGTVLLQFGLGIFVVLTGVPIELASLHQVGAFTLLTLLVIVHHRMSDQYALPSVVPR